MKTAAIIAEYNPFHNGHAYQLAEVRKRSGADFLIVLMSGDFVQRGTPAIFDKYLRTEAALQAGADLVLELPVFAAAGSAQRFAEGAVSILNGLGIVDELWFGSEEGVSEKFSLLADVLLEEPDAYRELLKTYLRKGLSYPAARAAALSEYLRLPDAGDFLKQPNNILGLEYVLALKKCGSSILPMTLKREGSGYHETQAEGSLSSATAVRSSLLAGDLDSVKACVPAESFLLYEEEAGKGFLFTEDALSEALRYRLWMESKDSLQRILDINKDLASRIINRRPEFRDVSSFAELLQTRNQTRTAMQRALLHILLEITEEEVQKYEAQPRRPVRILGISKKVRSGGLLSSASQSESTALTANPGTHPLGSLYEKDRLASEYYEAVKCSRTGEKFIPEYSRRLLIL